MKVLVIKLSQLLLVFMVLAFTINVFGQNAVSAKPKLIRGDVFIIEKTTTILPKDFTKLQPITTIFVSEINVPNRAWNNGFPDLPEIYEWFAIEYTATFSVNQDSNYKFRLFSDDGAKLWIDKKLVIDNDGVHEFLPVGGSIKLTKGEHEFKLQFFQGPRYEAGIQLFVKNDGAKEEIFPGSDIELIAGKSADSPKQ